MKVFVSPNSKLDPTTLWYHTLILGVEAREKPYGLVITGPEKEVQNAVQELRKLDPTAVFTRESAPPVKGHRVFSGFLQVSGEYSVLPLISEALRCNTSSEASTPEQAEVTVTGARLVRCRYIHPYLGHVEAAVFKLVNGEVLVRCLDGEGRCGWYNCTCCPYGTLIKKRRRFERIASEEPG